MCGSFADKQHTQKKNPKCCGISVLAQPYMHGCTLLHLTQVGQLSRKGKERSCMLLKVFKKSEQTLQFLLSTSLKFHLCSQGFSWVGRGNSCCLRQVVCKGMHRFVGTHRPNTRIPHPRKSLRPQNQKISKQRKPSTLSSACCIKPSGVKATTLSCSAASALQLPCADRRGNARSYQELLGCTAGR